MLEKKKISITYGDPYAQDTSASQQMYPSRPTRRGMSLSTRKRVLTLSFEVNHEVDFWLDVFLLLGMLFCHRHHVMSVG